MLTSTFIHTPGIGAKIEQRIWSQGITTWEDLLERQRELKIPVPWRERLVYTVEESIERLDRDDYAYFSHALAHRDHWRAVPEFEDRIAYVDIETTGMGDDHQITVIGLYDGHHYRHFVQGENLDDFPDAISRYSMLVTFFGSGFDLPFIRRNFRRIQLDQLHVDLCFALKRVGYSGGLKSIEQRLGIKRRRETVGLSGWDAVRLWYDYKNGDDAAIELLLAYNKEDVVNLATLLPFAYDQLRAKTFVMGIE